jgi:hypothetical protein
MPNPLIIGAPEEIRTPDPLVRSQVLYPAELRAHLLCGNWIPRSYQLLIPFIRSYLEGASKTARRAFYTKDSENPNVVSRYSRCYFFKK